MSNHIYPTASVTLGASFCLKISGFRLRFDVNVVTEAAEASDALVIAVFALVFTAVARLPPGVIPSTSPLLSKLNTASSLSKSLATAPVAEVTVLLTLVDKAPAIPVISAPENVNCDSNSVTLLEWIPIVMSYPHTYMYIDVHMYMYVHIYTYIYIDICMYELYV